MYIAQFITYQNIVLIGSLKVQIEQLNMLAMPKDQYNEYLNYQIKMEGGIVESIAQLWFKYFDFES